MNGQHNENGPTSRGNDFAGPGTSHLDQRRGSVPVSDSIHTTTDSELVGQRIALIDLDVVRLGRISYVTNDGEQVRITWDDGFDDSGPQGLWVWPHPDMKPVV